MTTSKVKPTASNLDKGTVRYSHPAYAAISVSRPSVSPGIHLFGSDLEHRHVVSITIREATLDRHLNSDWVHPGKLLMEVTLSETQWANLISGIGQHGGVPVTLESVVGSEGELQRVPQIDPLKDSRKEVFNQEMASDLRNKLSRMQEVIAELGEVAEGKTVSKVKVRDLHRQLAIQIGNLPGYFEFMAERFQETTEGIVSQAKGEVDAYFNSNIRRLGLKAATEMLSAESEDFKRPEVKLPEFLP